MGNNTVSFSEALKYVYRKEPCRVLPNALWKTLIRIGDLDCSFELDGNEVTKLVAREEKRLFVFWKKNPGLDELSKKELERMDFMVIHDEYYRQLDGRLFSYTKSYFRIIHDNKETYNVELPAGFAFENVNIASEIEEVSELIGRCYEDIHPDVDTVRSWMKHPVFEKDLWVWVIDKKKDTPVALGIAEIDKMIQEGSLEWIQVLPDYQGKGLGSAVVFELLNRLKSRVAFTTVSGEVGNKTNPERLYRKCGFYGNDIWWVLRK